MSEELYELIDRVGSGSAARTLDSAPVDSSSPEWEPPMAVLSPEWVELAAAHGKITFGPHPPMGGPV